MCRGDGTDHKVVGIDRHALGAVVRLVDADKVVCQLEHVVAQTDHYELRVPAAARLPSAMYATRPDMA